MVFISKGGMMNNRMSTQDRIRNENIRDESVEVASITEKMRENRLRGFGCREKIRRFCGKESRSDGEKSNN